MATTDDDVADLLEQHGKADDWYEMYKAVELAERIAGGEHKLRQLLGGSAADCKNFKQTANFYRHARAPRPNTLTSLGDKAFDANWIVEELNQRGAKVVISQRPKRISPIAIDLEMYKWRHLIENFFCKLREFKRIAMRACETDQSFEALINLCSAVINSR